MRSCASSNNRGFTLLELVVAMACSAILVALLASVWIQMMRTSTAVMGEAAQHRGREAERRDLQRLLLNLRWSPTSLAPGGALPWEASPGRISVWSGESAGQSAGPVRWTLEARPEGVSARIADPLGPSPVAPVWSQVQDLRLEALLDALQEGGEEARWTALSGWDAARPFRPAALRLWIRWKGQDIEECLVRTL